ncbi:hypothetical protein BU24DRAFT_469246 [Aaosphaeria arxii CBS 175.79]|uniref:Nuclear cap-binding protein subunit 2 n=1 Tax=Aaosphaeria arxii CBS 175.79 TaxID=1450172 RepID=A0A6A5Y612_9PLEO|nr:uncharacterized protein BU24DRAFT_469246 [Aaosphaeria arxii CBS 175.79]KAF2020477.1 hypothetical protein BU24DRAFT_469246 [Aaosphaeria arxii CBS 175.79]
MTLSSALLDCCTANPSDEPCAMPSFLPTKYSEIKRLIMGLTMGPDRFQKTPCRYCFVEYYTHQDAPDCMKCIGGMKLDERIFRCDLDEGFAEGRQYGYMTYLSYISALLPSSFMHFDRADASEYYVLSLP